MPATSGSRPAKIKTAATWRAMASFDLENLSDQSLKGVERGRPEVDRVETPYFNWKKVKSREMPASPAKPARETRTASQTPSAELMDKAKQRFPVWDENAAAELDKLKANPPSMSTNAKGYARYLVLQELEQSKRAKG